MTDPSTIAAIIAANATEPRYTAEPRHSNDAAERALDKEEELMRARAEAAGHRRSLDVCNEAWLAKDNELDQARARISHLEHEAAALDALHTQAVADRDAQAALVASLRAERELDAPDDQIAGPWEAVNVMGVWLVGRANGHLLTKIPAGSIGAEQIARLMASAPTLRDEIAQLREQLDQAHGHVGALLGPEGRTAATKQAAMTWLRREAK